MPSNISVIRLLSLILFITSPLMMIGAYFGYAAAKEPIAGLMDGARLGVSVGLFICLICALATLVSWLTSKYILERKMVRRYKEGLQESQVIAEEIIWIFTSAVALSGVGIYWGTEVVICILLFFFGGLTGAFLNIFVAPKRKNIRR